MFGISDKFFSIKNKLLIVVLCSLCSLFSYASELNEKRIEVSATTEKIVFIDGPLHAFSIEVYDNDKLIVQQNSITSSFPFTVSHLSKTASSSTYHIRILLSNQEDSLAPINIQQFDDSVSKTIFKNIINSDVKNIQTEYLLQNLTDMPVDASHYVWWLLLDYLLNVDQTLIENSLVENFISTSPPGMSDIDTLRFTYLSAASLVVKKDYLQAINRLVDLMKFYQARNLDSQYPEFKYLIKSKYVFIVLDTELNKNRTPTKDGNVFCQSGQVANQNELAVIKCILDETYLSLNADYAQTALYEIIKSYWLYYNLVDQHDHAVIFLTSVIEHHAAALPAIQLSTLYGLKGNSLQNIGRLADAIYNYHLAIAELEKTNSENTNVEFELWTHYYNLALAYMRVSEKKKAQSYINNSLKIAKTLDKTREYYISYYALAKIQRASGNSALASEMHREVIKHISDNSYYNFVAKLELINDEILNHKIDIADTIWTDTCRADNPMHMLEAQVIDCLLQKIDISIYEQNFVKANAIVKLTSNCLAERNCSKTTLLAIQTPTPATAVCTNNDSAFIPHTHYPIKQIKLAVLQIKANHACEVQNRAVYLSAQELILNLAKDMSQVESFLSESHKLFETYLIGLLQSMSNLDNIIQTIEAYHDFNYSTIKFSNNRLITNGAEQGLVALWNKKLELEKRLLVATEKQENSELRFNIDQLTETISAYFNSLGNPTSIDNIDILSASAIIKNLESGELLAHFIFVDNAYHVLISDHKASKIYKLKDTHKIQRLLAEFETHVNQNKLLSLLRNVQIRDFFPSEQVDLSKINKLIIIPDGGLGAIPFDSFNYSTNPNIYMPVASKINIVNSFSASRYFKSVIARAKYDYDIAIVADPTFAYSSSQIDKNDAMVRSNWLPSLPPLPYTRQEALNIASLFKHKKLKLMTGLEATNDALFAPSTRNTRILHIATHGFLDSDYPELAAFATSRSDASNTDMVSADFVTMNQLTNYHFNSELVLLSGCDTAKGNYYNGIGIKGLTQKFIQQGAGSVISSLWKIDDLPTSLFMKHFYTALKENQGNTTQALFSAKRKFIQSGIYSNPKYWAGFVLTVANRQYEKINLN